MNAPQNETAAAIGDHSDASEPCRFCGDRPGREVYRGICWICELGVLAGDLPKVDQSNVNGSGAKA